MEGRTPAPWFVELEGRLQGPFTTDELMKLLTDGALTFESRVFDSQANAWVAVSHALTQPEHPADAQKAQPGWQPPPKPSELRDIHIVDLNLEKSSTADYFALVHEHKIQLDSSLKNHLRPPAASPSGQVSRAAAKAPKRREPEVVSSQPARKVKVQEVAPEAAKPAEPTRAPSSPVSGGILTVEEDRGLFFNFFSGLRTFLVLHRGVLGASVALVLVFVGTYGVVLTVGARKGRDPAAASQARQANTAPTPMARTARGATAAGARPDGSASASSTGIGSGQHRVLRPGAAAGFAGGRVLDSGPRERGLERAETPTDGPQFYSSREQENTASGDQVPTAQQAPGAGKTAPAGQADSLAGPAGTNSDAALQSATVDPPAFMPPYDPTTLTDPARAPSADGTPTQPQNGQVPETMPTISE